MLGTKNCMHGRCTRCAKTACCDATIILFVHVERSPKRQSPPWPSMRSETSVAVASCVVPSCFSHNPCRMCIGGSGEALAVNLPTTSGTYRFHRTDTISVVAPLGRELIFPANGLPEARGMASIVSFHSLASQQGPGQNWLRMDFMDSHQIGTMWCCIC